MPRGQTNQKNEPVCATRRSPVSQVMSTGRSRHRLRIAIPGLCPNLDVRSGVVRMCTTMQVTISVVQGRDICFYAAL
jgi:hypothetical protein